MHESTEHPLGGKKKRTSEQNLDVLYDALGVICDFLGTIDGDEASNAYESLTILKDKLKRKAK